MKAGNSPLGTRWMNLLRQKYKSVTKDQSRDTGMAMVLLCLTAAAVRRREGYLFLAIVLQLVNMTVPHVYRSLAVLWLGLSTLIGEVISQVLLTIIFFVVVVPVSILRRVFGKDPLRLRAFKAGNDSVMVERNHVFVAQDLERPY
jgi:hypothetical protein